jgi:hypothetical protein
MAPERQVSLDSLLQAGQAQFLKASSFRLRKWLIHHLGKSQPSPKRERCAQFRG